jgi:dTDP-4-dehydrorhamnose 3,5-epimerase
VVVQAAPFVTYGGDNILTELFRPEWLGVFAEGEAIDHLYTVKAPSGGIRKEWYFHEKTLDRYMILDGLLDIDLYDARVDSPTHGKFVLVSLGEPGAGLPNAIRIPPLVWHSLQWQTSRGQFLNAKAPSYNRAMPDKFRVPMEELPEAITWNV